MKIRLNYFWNKKEKLVNLKRENMEEKQGVQRNFQNEKRSNISTNQQEKKTRNESFAMSSKTPIFKVYNSKGEVLKYDLQCMKKLDLAKNTVPFHLLENKRWSDKDVESVDDIKEKIGIKEDYQEDYRNDKIRKKRHTKRPKIPRQSYSLLFCMLGLAVASFIFAYQNYRDISEEDYAVYSSIEESEEKKEEISKEDKQEENKNEQNSLSNNLDTKKEEKNQIVQNHVNTKKTNSVKKVTPKVEPLKFSKPIEGEVLKIYSIDKVIYSKTLELWKTHDGIDIKAKENTIVKAIEKGTVEKIYDDSFYGKTIVIDHGQGYKSCYSNLSEDVFVKEKQVVTKLAKIGKIGTTAIGEIKDEPHLHFTLIKNNEITDPSSIFQ